MGSLRKFCVIIPTSRCTMTKMTTDSFEIVKASVGEVCWYVSVGGCTLPSFELALGKKLEREQPLKNPAHTDEYRQYRGESSLLVWCSWRLDSEQSSIVSSDDDGETIKAELRVLIGPTFLEIIVHEPVWDAVLRFSGGLSLKIFCDHTEQDPSLDGNWEWETTDGKLFVGPGNKLEVA